MNCNNPGPNAAQLLSWPFDTKHYVKPMPEYSYEYRMALLTIRALKWFEQLNKA